jgi:hypothetical protein
MLEAILGFLGAVVGVAFGVAAAYVFERRREWLDARTGLLLVDGDLRDAQKAVATAIQTSRWPTGANKAWLSTWSQHRPLIARRLRRESEFRKLVDAYGRMDELESGLNASRKKEGEVDEFVIDTEDEKFLTAIQERLEARDEVFGESPDYDELLGGRPLIARWSNRRRTST